MLIERLTQPRRSVVRPAQRRRFSPARVYRVEFAGRARHERMFIGSVAFFLGFGAARAITHAIRANVGPFRNLSVGGRHLHHMVFGIGGLLMTGYLWLLLIGTETGGSRTASRATAAGFGVASALTLDEFALWLRLEDVYWARQGRASIDAVMAFAAFVSIGLWGGPFLRATGRQLLRPFRRALPKPRLVPTEGHRKPALE